MEVQVAKQEIAYETKQTSNKNSKEAIARKCVEFVHPQDSVFLDAGTTTCEIAKLIRDIPDIIIVTNDLEIAQVLKTVMRKYTYVAVWYRKRREVCLADMRQRC